MSPATYLTVSAALFTPPNPCQLPPRPGNLFTQQWQDTKSAHQWGVGEYTTYNNLDKSVNQQIIKLSVDPIFLKPLENHISGYSHVTANAMIHFLFNEYRNITPLQLDANGKMTKEQWDPLTPITCLLSEIQDGFDKADAGNAPYTVNQVCSIWGPCKMYVSIGPHSHKLTKKLGPTSKPFFPNP
jgi:hypothetical protein